MPNQHQNRLDIILLTKIAIFFYQYTVIQSFVYQMGMWGPYYIYLLLWWNITLNAKFSAYYLVSDCMCVTYRSLELQEEKRWRIPRLLRHRLFALSHVLALFLFDCSYAFTCTFVLRVASNACQLLVTMYLKNRWFLSIRDAVLIYKVDSFVVIFIV